jgi:hypothetical protein
MRLELDVFAEDERAHELLGFCAEGLTHFGRVDPCHTDSEQLLFYG